MFKIVIVVVIIVFSVVACKDGSSDSSPKGPVTYEGWPPETVLLQYGISGMSCPTDAWSITYEEPQLNTLDINFIGTITTKTNIKAYFVSNGWTDVMSIPGDAETPEITMYVKGLYSMTFAVFNNTIFYMSISKS